MTDSSGSDARPQPDAPKPDPRRNAWREDIAAEDLWDKVLAPRYVPAVIKQLMRPSAQMRRRPDTSLPYENEAVFGEMIRVYDEADGWAWIQLARDRYVGYVPSAGLATKLVTPTHRVSALGTFLYPRPDIKSPVIMGLSLNSQLAITASDERFSTLETGGFVITRHIADLDKPARDFVEIAERFAGVPYLWGGRTRLGLDCSALVQLSMEAAGLNAPRDTDMQIAELGSEVAIPSDLEGLQRGDLVFWPGHVGIMVDGVMMVHANAHHMAVAIEPLVTAARRISRHDQEVAGIRRIST